MNSIAGAIILAISAWLLVELPGSWLPGLYFVIGVLATLKRNIPVVFHVQLPFMFGPPPLPPKRKPNQAPD